ncbi:cupin domain-containing protein [Rhizobium alvei]|uniref:Cupin domain-containing protein n=1 Tax=Rhizobium alvei TaxID=1132659 RepID=A0ABT8YJ86_9HYPH|nr:cupin domain-containing protein [Rhizobium alvei]MDO6963310.1 cupin domain-containing protein [Rhizobium alvei]
MNMHVTTDSKTQQLWFGNTRVAIRIPSATGGNGLSVIEHWMPHGEAPPLHIHHNEDEIFHILYGEMQFRIGDVEIVGKAGETLLAPMGIAHAFRVISPAGAHCLTITRGSDFESMVLATSRPATHGGLPKAVAPSPEMIDALVKACAEHGISIIGPPLG